MPEARNALTFSTLELALTAQVCLEFGKHAEHIEKGLAGRAARVYRLLRGCPA
jgi:hypothetical protein